ncbi:restriction endonuclease subunit S [Aquimarina agarivorans]|uniref:restriction endonuclease subunit S n=1 Tax=Aquimarina agarivorans TaxID=980584 RepID=UPI000248F5A8|nr:restriction endonuclease subunit S [Aquimarina agarivorans]
MKEQKFIPELRFPEFTEKWKEKAIDTIFDRVVNTVEVEKEQEYQEIGIRSHGKGIFHKEPVYGKALGNKRVFWLEKDLFIVNIVFAWEMAVAKTTEKENGLITSHRFPMYKPKVKKLDLDFILFFFLRKRGKHILELASPGGAGRNKTLGQKEFAKSKIIVPKDITEQQKIGSFLLATEEKIKQLQEKKSLLEKYKNGVMQKIFNQEIRFKDDNGNDYPDWGEKSLGQCLDYEQPTNYLVSSTDYDDSFDTPVLTAGKTFILGYTDETNGIYNNSLPVILFDDFTTSIQYVDFPFKAKSSAMKILIAKEDENINYLYQVMLTIRYKTGGHGRHWISKYSKIKISYPKKEEQDKIAVFLSEIDNKIETVNTQLKNTKTFKKGLLQKMFV